MGQVLQSLKSSAAKVFNLDDWTKQAKNENGVYVTKPDWFPINWNEQEAKQHADGYALILKGQAMQKLAQESHTKRVNAIHNPPSNVETRYAFFRGAVWTYVDVSDAPRKASATKQRRD